MLGPLKKKRAKKRKDSTEGDTIYFVKKMSSSFIKSLIFYFPNNVSYHPLDNPGKFEPEMSIKYDIGHMLKNNYNTFSQPLSFIL